MNTVWKLLLFFVCCCYYCHRLRELEGIGKSLKYYRDTYHPLDDWIQQVETTQKKIQENQPENSKTLATQLNQQKVCEGYNIKVVSAFGQSLFGCL